MNIKDGFRDCKNLNKILPSFFSNQKDFSPVSRLSLPRKRPLVLQNHRFCLEKYDVLPPETYVFTCQNLCFCSPKPHVLPPMSDEKCFQFYITL